MKNRFKQVLIFLGGLFVGGLVVFIIMGRVNQQQYANSYTLSVMEKAFEATDLRAHRQDELFGKVVCISAEDSKSLRYYASCPVTMIIWAGKFIRPFGKNSSAASLTSRAT